MAFWLFILLNVVLFLRPAELVPAVRALPLYQVVIIACIGATFGQILNQLDISRLKQRPITACVVGMLAAIFLSHMSHMFFWGARYDVVEFSKTVLYYLVLVGVITSVRRLEQFYVALLAILVVMASLSLAQHHGVIYIPELDSLAQREFDQETGEVRTFSRLKSTGIFSDPNDFGMILVAGVVLCVHRVGRAGFFGKGLAVGLAVLFVYLIYLTRSRGAALAFIAAAGALVYARWGFRKALYASLVVLPIGAVIFASRDDGGVASGTGQSRIQLWAAGMAMIRQDPLFGLGANTYSDEAGHVAHNSFIHCYAELGLIGGTVFFGAFYFGLITLWKHIHDPEILDDPALHVRSATALAILVGFTVSMLTLSRAYVVPTYMVLGIVTVTARLNGLKVDVPLPRLTVPLAKQLVKASAVFFVITYIYIKVMVRWS